MKNCLMAVALFVICFGQTDQATAAVVLFEDINTNVGIGADLGGADTQGFAFVSQNHSSGNSSLESSVSTGVAVNSGAITPDLATSLTANAGGDNATVNLSVNGGSASAASNRYFARASELNLVELLVDPTLGLDSVSVDVTYAQSAAVSDSSSPTTQVVDARALSNFFLIDSTTFDLPFGRDDVFAPLFSSVSADINGDLMDSVANTINIELKTNVTYWVLLSSTVVFETTGNATGAMANLSAFADPVFVVSDPSIATRVNVERTLLPAAVPEPTSLTLMILLSALLFSRKSVRAIRVRT